MKKIMFALFLGILVMSFAVADSDNGQGREGANSIDAAKVTAMNAGQIQARTEARERIREGEYEFEGEQLRIRNVNEVRTRLQARNVSAETDLELEENDNALRARLSNGQNADIKIMPGTASETALARLRLRVCSTDNNCTIELKEVGEGNRTRAAYEVRAEKQAKVLGIFRARMQVASQVDAETGEVIAENRPWWAIIASEEDEIATEEEMCKVKGGKWREFPNTCVDNCKSARQGKNAICGQAFTPGCDCGDYMCWNGESCEAN